MRMHERSIVFDGVDVCEEFGLHYSTFTETLPQRKLVTVSIPYGTDIDITDRLGMGGWTNGSHQIKFLLYSETEEGRIAAKDGIIALMHGRRAQYVLTWDSQYTYTGRAKVTIEHRSENVDLVTIDIDRHPWKVIEVEEVVSLVDQYNAYSSLLKWVDYNFNQHVRYRDVRITALTKVNGRWLGSSGYTTYGQDGSTNELIADDVYSGAKYQMQLYNIIDWLMRLDEATGNYIVNRNRATYSGTDVSINSTYTVTDGDIHFDDYDKQFVTLTYEAWDV